MENEYQKKSYDYGKRPLWQWIVLYVVIGAVAYGLVYYFAFSKKGGYAPAPSQSYSAASGQSIVTYTDSGFSPSALTIKKGDAVVFKNTASDDMQVSSNPHPIHNGYPTTGGCVSSTFDSCGNISPGQSWSFTFGIAGTWGYHNHLNPSEGGTIIVQ